MGNDITKKITYAHFDLIYKSNIVIYGAGGRAVELVRYLQEHHIEPEKIFVSEKSGNPDQLYDIDVVELKNLNKGYNGKTMIIATLEKYHMEIMSKLQYYKFKEIIPLRDEWKGKEYDL